MVFLPFFPPESSSIGGLLLARYRCIFFVVVVFFLTFPYFSICPFDSLCWKRWIEAALCAIILFLSDSRPIWSCVCAYGESREREAETHDQRSRALQEFTVRIGRRFIGDTLKGSGSPPAVEDTTLSGHLGFFLLGVGLGHVRNVFLFLNADRLLLGQRQPASPQLGARNGAHMYVVYPNKIYGLVYRSASLCREK